MFRKFPFLRPSVDMTFSSANNKSAAIHRRRCLQPRTMDNSSHLSLIIEIMIIIIIIPQELRFSHFKNRRSAKHALQSSRQISFVRHFFINVAGVLLLLLLLLLLLQKSMFQSGFTTNLQTRASKKFRNTSTKRRSRTRLRASAR